MPRIPAPREAPPTMRTDEFTNSIYRIIDAQLSRLEKSRLPPRRMRSRYFAANARTLASLVAIVEGLFEVERRGYRLCSATAEMDEDELRAELERRLDHLAACAQQASSFKI